MYCDHFKMIGQPFSERAPVEHILKDDRMSQALARLEFMVQSGTIALITGQTGVGKSSLIKLFVHSLNSNRYRPVYLHVTHIENSTSFLKLIVSGLGEIPRYTKEKVFMQILEKARSSEPTIILIIDESQLLKTEALTDLRLLVSSALDDAAPLKIVLCGQDNLLHQLKQSCHQPLVDRISVRCHLPSLTKIQTQAYIDFQMRSVEASDKIFDPEVKTLIHEFAAGIPRQINNISTACLIQAAMENVQKIGQAIFNQAAGECKL